MNNTITKRTIQHPGFEYTELDLSSYKNALNDAVILKGLFFGFAQQGPINQVVSVKSIEEFTTIFGEPENDYEFYLYKAVESYIEAGIIANVIRIPYINNLYKTKSTKAIKYTIVTDNHELIDYKSLFEVAPSFKNINAESVLVTKDELETLQASTSNVFYITNKFNATLNDGEELLISVVGRSNAIPYQGFINKATPDIFDYEKFYTVNPNTVGKPQNLWEYDTINNINTNFIRWIPEIKTVLKQDTSTGFYNKFIQKSDIGPMMSVIVAKIVKSKSQSGKFTISILETFSGSLSANAINNLSRESEYIGDIINANSEYINFFGPKTIKNFKATDELFIKNSTPVRINVSEEDNLKKLIPTYSEFLEIFNTISSDIKDIKFTDIFDCGLTSILSESYINESGDNVYQPNKVVKTNSDYSESWTQFANILSKYTKYVNPYGIIYLDSPRSLTLKSSLSRYYELNESEESIINSEILNSLRIYDNSNSTINVTWLKAFNEFSYIDTWVPASCYLAKVVGKLPKYSTPPAGINYAKITDAKDVSFIPSPDIKDLLYTNHFNYCSITTNKELYFDGNINCSFKDYQFNRINVRKFINCLKIETINYAKTFIGEINNIANRLKFKDGLSEIYEAYVFDKSLDSYIINVNNEINPEIVAESGELRAQIIVKPVSCIEFIIADFIITRTGINFFEF